MKKIFPLVLFLMGCIHQHPSSLTPIVWEPFLENTQVLSPIHLISISLSEAMLLSEGIDSKHELTWVKGKKMSKFMVEEPLATRIAFDERHSKLFVIATDHLSSYRLTAKGFEKEKSSERNALPIQDAYYSLIRDEIWVLSASGFEKYSRKDLKFKEWRLDIQDEKEIKDCHAEDFKVSNDGKRIYLMCLNPSRFLVISIDDKKITDRVAIDLKGEEVFVSAFGIRKGNWVFMSSKSDQFVELSSQHLKDPKVKMLEAPVKGVMEDQSVWENILWRVSQSDLVHQLSRSKF